MPTRWAIDSGPSAAAGQTTNRPAAARQTSRRMRDLTLARHNSVELIPARAMFKKSPRNLHAGLKSFVAAAGKHPARLPRPAPGIWAEARHMSSVALDQGTPAAAAVARGAHEARAEACARLESV